MKTTEIGAAETGIIGIALILIGLCIAYVVVRWINKYQQISDGKYAYGLVAYVRYGGKLHGVILDKILPPQEANPLLLKMWRECSASRIHIYALTDLYGLPFGSADFVRCEDPEEWCNKVQEMVQCFRMRKR